MQVKHNVLTVKDLYMRTTISDIKITRKNLRIDQELNDQEDGKKTTQSVSDNVRAEKRS